MHRLAWKAARRIWAVSRATSEKYARAGADSGRIEVLHNGHDFESPIPDSKPLLRGLGIPDEAFVLCPVGRLSPNKGQHLAIEALARLESLRPLHLVLVGDDRIADGNSDYVSELKRAVVQHGLEGRVHFAGFQADLRSWYGVGDVVLIPSAEEGFPLTALEAAAAGVPMVATRATGLVEMPEEFGGLRCVERSVDSLIAELEHLLLNPESQSPTETRARLKAAFDLPAFPNRVLQAFARAASPTGNGITPIRLHPWSPDECRLSVGSDYLRRSAAGADPPNPAEEVRDRCARGNHRPRSHRGARVGSADAVAAGSESARHDRARVAVAPDGVAGWRPRRSS